MSATRSIQFGARRFVLHGDAADHYFQNLDLERDQSALKQAMKRVLPPDGVAMDIGANIGEAMLLMAVHAPRGRVLAYEPDPRVHAHLAATIAANGLSHCEAHRLALGRATGDIPFFVNPNTTAASHLSPPDRSLQASGERVAVRRLDDVAAALDRLDLIKIDVEGFESDVLEGGRDTLRRLRPAALVEFNGFAMLAFADRDPRRVLEALLEMFAEVLFDTGGGLRAIDSREAMLDFLHIAIVHRQFNDDLLCLNPR